MIQSFDVNFKKLVSFCSSFLKKYNSWSFIDELGKTRFSKSSYIWIIIVPLALKYSVLFEEFINKVLKPSNSIDISLPFNWFVFFLGALLISLGSFVYYLFCPEFIKLYKNYGEFLRKGESIVKLKRFAQEFNCESIWDDITNLQHNGIFVDGDRMWDADIDKDVFLEIYKKANLHRNYMKSICFSFYMIGLFLFLGVIIQNIFFVCNYLFLNYM